MYACASVASVPFVSLSLLFASLRSVSSLICATTRLTGSAGGELGTVRRARRQIPTETNRYRMYLPYAG